MFNNYSNSQNINVNAVSGTIVKNYQKSFMKRFHLQSEYAKEILSNEPYMECCRNHERRSSKYPIVVIQMMVCGDMEVIAEIMWKEDFDEMFNVESEEKNV